jgi:hypothetical protein
MVAVSLLGRRRPLRHAHREPGNQQGRHVGKIVYAIAYHGERPSQGAGQNLRRDQQPGGHHRSLKHLTHGGGNREMGMQVGVVVGVPVRGTLPGGLPSEVSSHAPILPYRAGSRGARRPWLVRPEQRRKERKLTSDSAAA